MGILNNTIDIINLEIEEISVNPECKLLKLEVMDNVYNWIFCNFKKIIGTALSSRKAGVIYPKGLGNFDNIETLLGEIGQMHHIEDCLPHLEELLSLSLSGPWEDNEYFESLKWQVEVIMTTLCCKEEIPRDARLKLLNDFSEYITPGMLAVLEKSLCLSTEHSEEKDKKL